MSRVKKFVNTNIGLIPLEFYLETVAIQNGFESYKDMKSKGHSIDVKRIVEMLEDDNGKLHFVVS